MYTNIEAALQEGTDTCISLRHVSDERIITLVDSIKLHGSKIEHLDFFESNEITALGISYLMQEYGDKLKALSIVECGLTDQDVLPILERMKTENCTLRRLNLNDNCLTPETVQTFKDKKLNLDYLATENQQPELADESTTAITSNSYNKLHFFSKGLKTATKDQSPKSEEASSFSTIIKRGSP